MHLNTDNARVDACIEYIVSQERDVKFIYSPGDRHVLFTHIDQETNSRSTIQLTFVRLVTLILGASQNMFTKHARESESIEDHVTAIHLGGGYFLSICDARYGARIGEFHRVHGDSLRSFGKDVRIYENEWRQFLNVLVEMANCEYLLLPDRNVRPCSRTQEHDFWKKFFSKCDECEPWDRALFMLEFISYK